MNHIRPHGLANIQLIQLVSYNFTAHKWKITDPALIGLQIKEIRQASLLLVLMTEAKKNESSEHACFFFIPVFQVTIFNKYQSKVFLGPSLAINLL